jgi:hypothetical protein
MIPGAFASEIAKIPPMDEVLRRHSESLRKAAAKTTSRHQLKVMKRRGPAQIKVLNCFR